MKLKTAWDKPQNGSLRFNSENQLCWGDCNLAELANGYQGPAYIYNQALMDQRIQFFKSTFDTYQVKPQLHFAIKCNNSVPTLKLMQKNGLGIDAVSIYEVEWAIEHGFEAREIIFSGVAKTKHEISKAIQIGIKQINVESIEELLRIAGISKELQKPVNVVLRVNPNVEVSTHPYISTGFREHKFGIDLDLLPKAFEIIKKNTSIRFLGFSTHIGSLITEVGEFLEACEKMVALFEKTKSNFSDLSVLDLGGGLGIFYDSDDIQDESLITKYAETLKKGLNGKWPKNLQLEPGRVLVARAGILMAEVQYVKRTPHKNFLILDSGMSHLMRPTLYDSYHRIVPATLARFSGKDFETEVYDVVGPVCESSDFFAKSRSLPKMQEGDKVLILEAGAYGATMASSYNRFPLPKEIWV